MRFGPVSGRYAIARLDATAPPPAWPRGKFVSITRTAQELSVVCEESSIPGDVRREGGWRCLAVEGPIPFETVGVAASIASPLADAGISVFFVSTFDTDYILVKEESFDRACDALRGAGHEVAV